MERATTIRRNRIPLAMMTGFERYTKKTRRAMFLEEMEQVLLVERVHAGWTLSIPAGGKAARNQSLPRCFPSCLSAGTPLRIGALEGVDLVFSTSCSGLK